jgi:hypothetical protein
VAAKENPNVGGTRIVDLAYWGYPGYWSGDTYRMTVNAIKWAAQSKNPLPHPLTFGPIYHAYADDNPPTTPFDTYYPMLEVADDDHGKLAIIKQDNLYTTDFRSPCSTYTFPSEWDADTTHWRCYLNNYYLQKNCAYAQYNYYRFWGDIELDMPFDFSAYTFVDLEWAQTLYWYYASGQGHLIVQGSTDGGATWPYTVYERSQRDEGTISEYLRASISVSAPWAAGQSDVRFRWNIYTYYAYSWYAFSDLSIVGTVGFINEGNDTMMGEVIIENVGPGSGNPGGHPSSDVVDELGVVVFQDYAVHDPALWVDTEWFAYRWDMDDGTVGPWIYKGSMAPPTNVVDILLVHSLCGSGEPNCRNTAVREIENGLLAHPSVRSVDRWDIFNRLIAPSMSTIMQYDVLWFETNWGWNPSYEPRWETVREDFGDRAADFVDMGGGVATGSYALDSRSPYGWGPVWQILGRYVNEDYAPYVPAPASNNIIGLGEIFEPTHPIMRGVTSAGINAYGDGGDHAMTEGGLNLADWGDGNTAVGAKEHSLGATAHMNCFVPYMVQYGGSNQAMVTNLIGNMATWVSGLLPTPKIPDFAYVYGDNGRYDVDLQMVDDDMGWLWDPVAGDLVEAPGFTGTISHSTIPITVNNVDPTIHSVSATFDMDLCIRMSGNKGNMATLTLTGSDGTFEQVTAKRVPGKPVEACLDTATLDLTPRTTYEVGILYDPEDDDGANPTWIFEAKFPDGKVKDMRHTFKSDLGVQTWLVANKQVKRLALGQEINFDAVASDPGSDDLAFIWGWSDRTPYDICIYEHPGLIWGCAESDLLEALPFPEPDFTKPSNNVRSPEVDPIRARDHQTHVFFEQYFYYVTLIVADDDVKDPYPSTYLTPGLDMEIIELDF